jgi:hypothetical protein
VRPSAGQSRQKFVNRVGDRTATPRLWKHCYRCATAITFLRTPSKYKDTRIRVRRFGAPGSHNDRLHCEAGGRVYLAPPRFAQCEGSVR